VHRIVKNPQQYSQNACSTVPTDFHPSDTTHIKVGTQVTHPKFGRGTVRQLDASDASRKAKIDFADFGEKTLLLSFAKLKILDLLPA
jgi:DNA helicase-2/ATP-dependent DNA helicase PcrA